MSDDNDRLMCDDTDRVQREGKTISNTKITMPKPRKSSKRKSFRSIIADSFKNCKVCIRGQASYKNMPKP